MTKYGITCNDKLMGVTVHSNGDADCCGDVEYSLCPYNDNIWLVDSQRCAEKATKTDTPWYNADYHSPSNSYIKDKKYKLEVVKVELTIERVEQ